MMGFRRNERNGGSALPRGGTDQARKKGLAERWALPSNKVILADNQEKLSYFHTTTNLVKILCHAKQNLQFEGGIPYWYP